MCKISTSRLVFHGLRVQASAAKAKDVEKLLDSLDADGKGDDDEEEEEEEEETIE